jgi:hypothetical protein
VLFELSFLGAAFALWHGYGLAPPRVRAALLGGGLWALPALASAHAFHRAGALALLSEAVEAGGAGGQAGVGAEALKDMKERSLQSRRQWLSYWSVWPVLDALNTLLVVGAVSSSVRGKGGSSSGSSSSSSSVGGVDSGERGAILLICVVWCQWWGGAGRLHAFLGGAFRWTRALLGHGAGGGAGGAEALPWPLRFLRRGGGGLSLREQAAEAAATAAKKAVLEGGAEKGATKLGVFFRFVNAVGSVLSFARRNKMVAGAVGGVLGLVALYFTYKVLGLISGVLTLAIIWGAATKTAVSASDRKVDAATGAVTYPLELLYNEQLSFWVLLQVLSLLAKIPIAGFFISLWEPLLLACISMMGSAILSQLINVFLLVLAGVRARKKAPGAGEAASGAKPAKSSTPKGNASPAVKGAKGESAASSPVPARVAASASSSGSPSRAADTGKETEKAVGVGGGNQVEEGKKMKKNEEGRAGGRRSSGRGEGGHDKEQLRSRRSMFSPRRSQQDESSIEADGDGWGEEEEEEGAEVAVAGGRSSGVDAKKNE